MTIHHTLDCKKLLVLRSLPRRLKRTLWSSYHAASLSPTLLQSPMISAGIIATVSDWGWDWTWIRAWSLKSKIFPQFIRIGLCIWIRHKSVYQLWNSMGVWIWKRIWIWIWSFEKLASNISNERAVLSIDTYIVIIVIYREEVMNVSDRCPSGWMRSVTMFYGRLIADWAC